MSIDFTKKLCFYPLASHKGEKECKTSFRRKRKENPFLKYWADAFIINHIK